MAYTQGLRPLLLRDGRGRRAARHPHFGVPIAVDDDWQAVVHGVPDSDPVGVKLQQDFICKIEKCVQASPHRPDGPGPWTSSGPDSLWPQGPALDQPASGPEDQLWTHRPLAQRTRSRPDSGPALDQPACGLRTSSRPDSGPALDQTASGPKDQI